MYGGAVFAVARLGLPAVAWAAVVIHTTFLIIAYVQLHHGCVRQPSRLSLKIPRQPAALDLLPITWPVHALLRTGRSTVPYLLIIALTAGGAAYPLAFGFRFRPNCIISVSSWGAYYPTVRIASWIG